MDSIKPDYYIKDGIECKQMIDAIISDVPPQEAFYLGNIVKYLWRYRGKNGIEDLCKAQRYIELLIESYREDCLSN